MKRATIVRRSGVSTLCPRRQCLGAKLDGRATPKRLNPIGQLALVHGRDRMMLVRDNPLIADFRLDYDMGKIFRAFKR